MWPMSLSKINLVSAINVMSCLKFAASPPPFVFNVRQIIYLNIKIEIEFHNCQTNCSKKRETSIIDHDIENYG